MNNAFFNNQNYSNQPNQINPYQNQYQNSYYNNNQNNSNQPNQINQYQFQNSFYNNNQNNYQHQYNSNVPQFGLNQNLFSQTFINQNNQQNLFKQSISQPQTPNSFQQNISPYFHSQTIQNVFKEPPTSTITFFTTTKNTQTSSQKSKTEKEKQSQNNSEKRKTKEMLSKSYGNVVPLINEYHQQKTKELKQNSFDDKMNRYENEIVELRTDECKILSSLLSIEDIKQKDEKARKLFGKDSIDKLFVSPKNQLSKEMNIRENKEMKMKDTIEHKEIENEKEKEDENNQIKILSSSIKNPLINKQKQSKLSSSGIGKIKQWTKEIQPLKVFKKVTFKFRVSGDDFFSDKGNVSYSIENDDLHVVEIISKPPFFKKGESMTICIRPRFIGEKCTVTLNFTKKDENNITIIHPYRLVITFKSLPNGIYVDPKTLKFDSSLNCSIGSGSQGSVMKTKINDQFVAVKKYEKIPENDEIKILKKLRHENIVNLFCVYVNDKCITHLVMELASGSLFQMYSKLSPIINCQIIKDAAKGLSFLHNQNYVHLDVNPKNILVFIDNCNNYIGKLTDFGISKSVIFDEEVKLPQEIGTHGYIAPEMLSEKHTFSKKSDIYSLGKTIQFVFDKKFKENKTITSTNPIKEMKSNIGRQRSKSTGRSNVKRTSLMNISGNTKEDEIKQDGGNQVTQFQEQLEKYNSLYSSETQNHSKLLVRNIISLCCKIETEKRIGINEVVQLMSYFQQSLIDGDRYSHRNKYLFSFGECSPITSIEKVLYSLETISEPILLRELKRSIIKFEEKEEQWGFPIELDEDEISFQILPTNGINEYRSFGYESWACGEDNEELSIRLKSNGKLKESESIRKIAYQHYIQAAKHGHINAIVKVIFELRRIYYLLKENELLEEQSLRFSLMNFMSYVLKTQRTNSNNEEFTIATDFLKYKNKSSLYQMKSQIKEMKQQNYEEISDLYIYQLLEVLLPFSHAAKIEIARWKIHGKCRRSFFIII